MKSPSFAVESKPHVNDAPAIVFMIVLIDMTVVLSNTPTMNAPAGAVIVASDASTPCARNLKRNPGAAAGHFIAKTFTPAPPSAGIQNTFPVSAALTAYAAAAPAAVNCTFRFD